MDELEMLQMENRSELEMSEPILKSWTFVFHEAHEITVLAVDEDKATRVADVVYRDKAWGVTWPTRVVLAGVEPA